MRHQDVADAVLLLWSGKVYCHPRLVTYIKEIIKPVSNHVTKNILYTALYFVHKLSLKYEERKKGTEYSAFLAGLIVADIITHDNAYSVTSWSRVSHRGKGDILALRREVLEILDYNLYVSLNDFREWVAHVDVILQIHNRKLSGIQPNFGIMECCVQLPIVSEI
jgi:hypothetical protein